MATMAIGLIICSAIAADQNQRLKPGDYVTITFSNKNDHLDGCYSVWSDGFVNMPFIAKIKAEGLTPSDLKTTLEKEYDRQEIYKNLQIRVERMEKPPDFTRYIQVLDMLNKEGMKEIEANPFWNKKGDFFIPRDQKALSPESATHSTNR
jgi:hypothetical protein